MIVKKENVDRGPSRAGPRESLFLLTRLHSEEGASIGHARVRNLSATGLMADSELPLAAGQRVRFDLRGIGQVLGEVVWSSDGRIGIAFDHSIDPQRTRLPLSHFGYPSLTDYMWQRRVFR